MPDTDQNNGYGGQMVTLPVLRQELGVFRKELLTEVKQIFAAALAPVMIKLIELEQRMDVLEQRMDALEQKMDVLEQRMDSIEQRIEEHEKTTKEKFDQIMTTLDAFMGRSEDYWNEMTFLGQHHKDLEEKHHHLAQFCKVKIGYKPISNN